MLSACRWRGGTHGSDIQRAFARLEWQSAELSRVSLAYAGWPREDGPPLSHEMHDELYQSLSGLRRMLSMVADGNFGAMRQECIGIVDEVLRDARKLYQILRPVILDDFGLDSGLRWLWAIHSARKFPCSTSRTAPGGSTATKRLTCTQEALTNIARHAEATAASVSLTVKGSTIHLEISDNGHSLKPASSEKSSSLGIVGMRACARQLGGELTIENRGKAGSIFTWKCPSGRLNWMQSKKIRVLLADDQAILRKGVRMLIEAQPDLEVVGEAKTGREAIEEARKLKPEVVVLDVSMLELSGIEARGRSAMH